MTTLWAGALDIDFLLIHAQGFSARLGPKNAWNGILDMGPLLVPKDLELLEQNLTAHLCELPDE